MDHLDTILETAGFRITVLGGTTSVLSIIMSIDWGKVIGVVMV
jgi:hypothetical protein